MHLSNLSQVLLRNSNLLQSATPLLVNMPVDNLGHELTQINPNATLTYFDNNFECHLGHKTSQNAACIFAASYDKNTRHDLVIIQFPKSKKELFFTFAMLQHCINEDSKILIVGENKSGIKSLEKQVKEHALFCDKVDSARHCILFEIALKKDNSPFNLEEWFHYYTVNLQGLSFQVAALPGVFSQAKLDVGSKVLLENLSNSLSGNILDFGCGAGVIACLIGLLNTDVNLTLADVSALALVSSEKTLAINKLSGKTIATNSLSHISERYDAVISNPPFHQGIKTNYQATELFLAGINQHLNKNGSLTIVANSFLKYAPIIEQAIGKVEKQCIEQGFTIYHAVKQT